MIWEYMVRKIPELNEEKLNDFGEEGWELVWVSGSRYVFKRPYE